MNTVISLKETQFRWQGSQRTILDIPHFSVANGEKIFLQGPSGSGKTSLLALIGGIHLASSGDVSVLGTSMSSLSAGARDQFRADHIGFVFQLFNLIPYLSVIENVCLPCRFSNARKSRLQLTDPRMEAKRLLTQLGLSDDSLLNSASTELSVGQQQRVAVARALIGSPDLIVADEPTSSLDADNRSQFIELLMNECEKTGATLLFVSHDRELGRYFDRSIALSEINVAMEGAR